MHVDVAIISRVSIGSPSNSPIKNCCVSQNGKASFVVLSKNKGTIKPKFKTGCLQPAGSISLV